MDTFKKKRYINPDFLTASNVWNSINNPVTSKNMIKGDDKSINNHNLMATEDAYYINIVKKEVIY